MDVVRNEILPPLARRPAHLGAAGRDHRRRRRAERRRAVRDQRPGSAEARSRSAGSCVERVKSVPGVVDLDTSLNVGKPELSVQVDRPKAADLGVQIGDAAEALRLLVGGDQVTTYNEGGEQYEVHLRARAENRSTEAAIGGADGAVVAARQRRRSTTSPTSRRARRRPTSTAWRASGRSRSSATCCRRRRRPRSRTRCWPSSTSSSPAATTAARFTGRSQELGRAAQNFVLAFVLSLVFMYLILAAQFESWLHPITILLSLPLTLPFALLSIIIFQQSLNIFSALGLLVLFGVVKKNSILQIDHANQLKETGLSTHDAIVQASRDRLRPILMTTLRVRRRHDPADRLERHRLRHQPRDRLRHLRRPVAGAAADAARHAGRLLAVRRCVEDAAVRPARDDAPKDRSDAAVAAGAMPSGAAMRRTMLVALVAVGSAPAPRRRRRPQAPATLRLTVDEAVKMALENNLDLDGRPARSRRSATRAWRRRPARSGRRSTPACSATTSCSRRPAS